MAKNVILLKVYKTPTKQKISIYSIYTKILKIEPPRLEYDASYSSKYEKISYDTKKYRIT